VSCLFAHIFKDSRFFANYFGMLSVVVIFVCGFVNRNILHCLFSLAQIDRAIAWEQGVGGSNPLAPTSYIKSDPFQGRSFVLGSGAGAFLEVSTYRNCKIRRLLSTRLEIVGFIGTVRCLTVLFVSGTVISIIYVGL